MKRRRVTGDEEGGQVGRLYRRARSLVKLS